MLSEKHLDRALSLGLQLVRGVYALSAILVVGAFGLGFFFATVDGRLENVEADVEEIKIYVVKDLGDRVKENEKFRLRNESGRHD